MDSLKVEPTKEVKSFFVYGSLRPDMKANWTDRVHKSKDFNVTATKAYLPHSKLFYHKRYGYAVTIYNPEVYTKDDVTIGYILEMDNIAPALKELDRIESYPDMYDRIVVKCNHETDHTDRDVYFYTIRKDQVDHHLMDLMVNDWSLAKFER